MNHEEELEITYSKLTCLLLTLLVTSGYSFDGLGAVLFQEIATIEGRKIYFDSEIDGVVQDNLRSDLDRLIMLNSSDLHGIDLLKLKSRISAIKVLVSVGEPFVGSGVRNDAVNFSKQNTIILNYQTTKKHSSTQTKINQWHEALGALGYNDENNLISSSIYMKATNPKLKFAPAFRERLEKQFNEVPNRDNRTFRSIDGGATGVGGGGDGETAEIKAVLLMYMNKVALNFPGQSEKFNAVVNRLIDTPIESDELASQYLSIKDFGRLRIGISKVDGNITILINPKEWQTVDSSHSLSDSNFELIMQIMTVIRASPIFHGVETL